MCAAASASMTSAKLAPSLAEPLSAQSGPSCPFSAPPLSPRAEFARVMALLPVCDDARRAACVRRLIAVTEAAPPELDPALARGGVAVAATYLARAALRLPEGRALLDALAVRASDAAGNEADGLHAGDALRGALRSALRRDRALQIEIACEARASPARSLMEELGAHSGGGTAAGPTAKQGLAGALNQRPDCVIRQVLEALEPEDAAKQTLPRTKQDSTDSSMRYTAAEVDAVFFQATETDVEVLHRTLGWRKPRSAQHLHVTDEDYYISAERPSLAARIADATAADPSTADRIVARDHGLLAFRHLAEMSSAMPVKTEIFQTEIARALANIFAGTTNLSKTAALAADTGLVGLLSQWACDSRFAAGGHLQIESFRALHNLSEAICPVSTDVGPRRVWINGLLPLQAPSLGASDSHQPQDTDVVFVHGLRGGPLRTWRSRLVPKLADEVSHETGLREFGVKSNVIATNEPGVPAMSKTIWPRDWLSKDAPRCRISSVGHDAGVLRGGLGRGMIGPSLANRASDIRFALHRSGVGQDGRKVVFVTHSYGGLLVKEVLTQDPALWSATKGIVFLGVPHFGSPVAGTLSGSSRIVLSSAVRELYPDESGVLARLNEVFCAAVESRSGEVTVMSFGEGELLELGGRQGRPTIRLDLVPPKSANPRVGHFEILEGVDHVVLPKPFSREDPVYQAVLDLTLKQAHSGTVSRRAALNVVEPDVDASGA